MADLGVTTAALSQAIRVATQGEIDQASARFSLSDRQVPIRVALEEGSRRNLSTIENMPVPTTQRRLGAAEGRRRDQLRRRPLDHPAHQPGAADHDRRRFAPGVVDGETPSSTRCRSCRTCPKASSGPRSGQQREEAKLVSEFLTALISGTFLVFAVLVLLYKRLMAPFVNMGSLLLAPLGGAIALHIAGHAVSMPVMIGILMLFGIVAKNSILLLDFTIEEMAKGVPKDEAIVDAGHKRAQPIVMTTMAMVAGMVPTAFVARGRRAAGARRWRWS